MGEGIAKEAPQSRAERDSLRLAAEGFARGRGFVPPLSLPELEAAAAELAAREGAAPEHAAWLAVILNNAVWMPEFSRTPHGMRVLLLPQCLRTRASCGAGRDEYGLLCLSCGRCPIGSLQSLADSLGAVSLVSESSSAVERLIEEGSVSAVVGVGCMESLEKSFPRILRRGVPAIAIPLLRGGCDSTEADIDWIAGALSARSDGFCCPTDAEVSKLVSRLFGPDELRGALGSGACADAAVSELARGGNRWRPRLLVAAYCAMARSCEPPEPVMRAALAVECFHKASLIHDDIEDGDEVRDGSASLFKRIGAPAALNAGDFLTGAGYSLLASCGEFSGALCAAAARAQKVMCSGQGAELAAVRSGAALSREECLEIYAMKTGGAFAAALELAAVCAGRDGELGGGLVAFAEKLGTAYQIFDDMRDCGGDPPASAAAALRRTFSGRGDFAAFYRSRRDDAYAALSGLRDAPLKRLLFSMAGRILGDV